MEDQAAIAFGRICRDGTVERIERAVPVERPIAIEINGISYAVLMATPIDLEDLATGFALTERLIDGAGDILGIELSEAASGTIVRVQLGADKANRIGERVRHRVSDAACGLCGVENLEQAMRALPRVKAPSRAAPAAIWRAFEELGEHQVLNRTTGAVHAAAACSAEGAIRLAREDVGRHNAFDKLIGAMARQHLEWDGGFALLSSRCSYELVEKAVLAGSPMLATISAPTTLAIQGAEAAGLPLRVLVRPDAMLASEA